MEYSPPGSSVLGFFQARILELPFPSPGDLPDPGIELGSTALQVDYLPSKPPGKPLVGLLSLITGILLFSIKYVLLSKLILGYLLFSDN